MPLRESAERAMAAAMAEVLPPVLAGSDPLVRRSAHADFQADAALGTARRAGTAPRDLAARLAAALPPGPWTAAVSGPGFVNLDADDEAVWGRIAALAADGRHGVPAGAPAERIVVDYSAPNVAKMMHVGHLRSTVIGDALVRVLTHLGADVVRQNHIGDWGTQFGMLIQYLLEHPEQEWHRPAGDEPRLSVLQRLYREAGAAFTADEAFAARSRARVVALQSGDPETTAVWRDLVAVSTTSFQETYERLGVLLQPGDLDGESRYNDALPEIAEELTAAGVAVESRGALCVFFDDIPGRDGRPAALIVRKSDGGFGYAATDLAAIRHRVRDLGADRILYLMDARQALHVRMVTETARRMGWLDGAEAAHVAFGTVLGPDGRPFKSRSGDTVALTYLLDQADAGARAALDDRDHGLTPEAFETVAAATGIGAVKYADLSNARTSDYRFDLDRMLSLTGDTSVYLQYAHARVRSLLAKAGPGTHREVGGGTLEPAERALALRLDAYAAVLGEVAATLEPHRLCGYLFDLAQDFAVFFEQCPVLRAEPARRRDRLVLARLTGDVLAEGLSLLGIAAPDRM